MKAVASDGSVVGEDVEDEDEGSEEQSNLITPDITKPEDEDEDESEDEEDEDDDDDEDDSDEDDSGSEDEIDLSNYFTREEVQNLLKEELEKTVTSMKSLQDQV